MSHRQQYPQQPDPQQGWGAQSPQQAKKKGKGKVAGLGCLGVVVLIGIAAAVSGGGGDSGKSDGSKADASASQREKPAAGTKTDTKSKAGDAKDDTEKGSDKKTVVFKVWGTAPPGALGPLDITYGSDSDNRKGKFANGKFEATLPLEEEAMYYNAMAQLQGSGDVNCSVTVGGKTKKGHASGDYNICDAQLSSGLLGGWD
ncbi:hypothetical protein [Streptomyces sp. NPDC093260]|uniref:hypothetical protein n=1 Tax=Streptomyces sp. NPDC093260 TaxID=3155073 RepID=UPI0034499DA3